VLRDASGEVLAYVYCEEAAAKLLSKDEARRIASNIAKLPELRKRRSLSARKRTLPDVHGATPPVARDFPR
jgi:hypothetical protein